MLAGETAGCADRKQRLLLSAYRGRVQHWRLDQRGVPCNELEEKTFSPRLYTYFSPFLKKKKMLC